MRWLVAADRREWRSIRCGEAVGLASLSGHDRFAVANEHDRGRDTATESRMWWGRRRGCEERRSGSMLRGVVD
ncbi:hypothetical protein RJT34_13572 [Clitoria ternatea]|uniref:Uncharacterized protein n=1 Tax=Clitoria ternatea TaxID=43366 RepID=A0AAN9JSB4_CLITE